MAADEYTVMLKVLRKELKGHYSEIAKKAFTTPAQVSRIMNGKRFNDAVLNVAIEYRDELRLKEQQRLLKLSKAIAS